jgi:hypothetical protein
MNLLKYHIYSKIPKLIDYDRAFNRGSFDFIMRLWFGSANLKILIEILQIPLGTSEAKALQCFSKNSSSQKSSNATTKTHIPLLNGM